MPISDTYPLVPNRIRSVSSDFKVQVVTFENANYEQRLPKQGKTRRTFQLTHEMINNEKLKILEDFWEDQKGQTFKFYFLDYIADEVRIVRFKSEALQVDRVNAKFSNVTVEVIEC